MLQGYCAPVPQLRPVAGTSGGPVAKTPISQCVGLGFDPLRFSQGTKSHMLQLRPGTAKQWNILKRIINKNKMNSIKKQKRPDATKYKKSTIYQVFYTHIKTYIVLYVNYISIKLEDKMGIFIVKTKKHVSLKNSAVLPQGSSVILSFIVF